jgi:DNA transposition AAA+ family ATPase
MHENTTTELPAVNRLEKSMAAEASSAHSRINVPLNLDNWKHLPQEVQDDLIWFHQHALDAHLQWDDAAEALDYDKSTVFKVLKGTYEGAWNNVSARVRSYRRIQSERAGIQRQAFAKNGITQLIWGGLDYAVANNSITLIVGESRMGKSATAAAWRDANNHGRSVLITSPAYGGPKGLILKIAEAVGVNRNQNMPQMLRAVYRSFNKNRILIVDEAHRLLPGDRRANPVCLEILRDIHDETHCSLALIATGRFQTALQHSEYMFEQILGRIGMPVRLPRQVKQTDIDPIIRQYVPRPGAKLMEACLRTANEHGRLGILVENLRVASRIASKEQKTERPKITDEHVFKAMAIRKQMMGETQYAKKD